MHRLLVLSVGLFALLLLLSSDLSDEPLDRPPEPGPPTLVPVQLQEPPDVPLPDQPAIPAAPGAESEWVTSGNPESIPVLIRWLQGPTHARYIKGAALAEFAAMGAQARPAVPAILAALQDPESTVRVQAAATLIHMDVQSKAAIRTLKEELNAPAADRRYAAETIGQLVAPDPPIDLGTNCWGHGPPPWVARPWVGKRLLPALVEALGDRDVNVRAAAAVTLGRIGPEAKAALPALRRALKDLEGGVQNSASQAIRKLTRTEPPK
jgi:hypothetical protein